MPVEIKELIIRAVAQPDEKDEGQAAPSPESTEAIVQETVKQVLRILKKSKER